MAGQAVFAAQRDPIVAHVSPKQFALLLDSFYQLVPFGTGGGRGRVGFGPNRISQITVDVEGRRLPDGSGRGRVARFAQRLAAGVIEECISRIGIRLSASANLLPDYVDLELKASFNTGFRNELLTCADRLNHQSTAEQLAWLRERLAPYGSGADPLDATATAVAHLLGDLSNEVANPVVRATLHALERAVAGAPAPVDWVI